MKNIRDLLKSACLVLAAGEKSNKMIRHPIYLGIFIDKNELLNYVPAKHVKIWADHCTLVFKPTKEQLEIFEPLLGRNTEIEILEEFFDDKCQTVSCSLIGIPDKLLPQFPHITISTTLETKPQYSNELLQTTKGVVLNKFPLVGVLDTYPKSLK